MPSPTREEILKALEPFARYAAYVRTCCSGSWEMSETDPAILLNTHYDAQKSAIRTGHIATASVLHARLSAEPPAEAAPSPANIAAVAALPPWMKECFPAEAAAPANAELTAWQSIDTAPCDGTEILAYRPDAGVFTAHFVSPEDGEADWFTTAGEHLPGAERPTHWMPLPAFNCATPQPPAQEPTDTEMLDWLEEHPKYKGKPWNLTERVDGVWTVRDAIRAAMRGTR